jgi:hypothetical protein
MPGFAQTVNGRLITSLDTWERHDTAGTSTRYARAYQIVQLDLTKANFGLHTYLQGTTDFSNPLGNDPRIRVYNLYFDAKNLANVVDLKLGRQPVFARIGASAMDGLTVKVHPFGTVHTLSLFGGGIVPPDEPGSLISNLKENYLLGAQFLTTAIPNARIGLQYLNRQMKPEVYSAIRRDTLLSPNETRTITVENSSAAYEFASLDVSYEYSTYLSLYGRLDYDINETGISRGEVSARYNASVDVGLTGEFIHREPRIPNNSIFSVFEHGGTDEIGFGVDYALNKLFSVYGRYAYLSLKDDHSEQITLGMNAGYGSLVYAHNFGYSGDLDGVYAQVAYPILNRTVIANGGIQYSSYKLSDSQAESENSFSGSLGVTIRPINTVCFDLQGQLITNNIYKTDFRLFAKLNYWFFQNLGLF